MIGALESKDTTLQFFSKTGSVRESVSLMCVCGCTVCVCLSVCVCVRLCVPYFFPFSISCGEQMEVERFSIKEYFNLLGGNYRALSATRALAF